MSCAEFDSSFYNWGCGLILRICLHGQACEDLIVYGQVFWGDLVGRFVIGALDDTMLW
jgi:hypothetical protein